MITESTQRGDRPGGAAASRVWAARLLPGLSMRNHVNKYYFDVEVILFSCCDSSLSCDGRIYPRPFATFCSAAYHFE